MPLHVQACWRNGGATQFRGSIPEQRLDRAGKEFGLGVGGGGVATVVFDGPRASFGLPTARAGEKEDVTVRMRPL